MLGRAGRVRVRRAVRRAGRLRAVRRCANLRDGTDRRDVGRRSRRAAACCGPARHGAPAGALNVFCARDIEAVRLETILYIRRLTGATAAPPNAPSEWIGWQVITPAADRDRYHAHAAAGLCARCGACPPRPGLRTCERCAAYQAGRAAALRARRAAAGRCVDCAAPAGDGHTRCRRCRRRYRRGAEWGRPAADGLAQVAP